MLLEKPLPDAPQSEPSLTLPPPYQPAHDRGAVSEFSLPSSSSGYNAGTSFAPNLLSPIASPLEDEDDLTRPSFSRSPPTSLPPPFTQEIFLMARNALDKGFPTCAPPFIPAHEPENSRGPRQSHPFVNRDVREDDWTRFLADIKLAASLTHAQREQASHIPIFSAVPVLGALASSTARHLMKMQRKKTAARVVDRWNHHFFRPRGLECVLTEGRTRLSGNKGAPLPMSFGTSCGPNPNRMREEDHGEESSSAGSSTPAMTGETKTGKLEKMRDDMRRVQKEQQRTERRRRRIEKRAMAREWAEKRTGSGWISDDGAYRLFVLSHKS